VTQVVLWTNIPRNLVLKQLEKQLGLRVAAASLSTGWLGNTHLRDVTIGLPLAEDSLVRVPAMRVKHTSLLGLLWTRAVTLQAIELDRPDILVRQDQSGRWNLQEVADLLGRTGGKETATDQAKTKTTRPTLPAVRVREATVVIVDRGGRTTTVKPLHVEGDPEGALTWRYDVAIGDVSEHSPAPGVRLTGRVAVGGSWRHEVDLRAANVEQWAKPWAGDAPPLVAVTAEWRGEVKAAGVAGRLTLAELHLGGNTASGTLGIGGEGGRVAVRPEDLFVHTPGSGLPELRLTAGKVALDGKSAAAEGLTVQAFGGVALVAGNYDWASGSADLKADWSDFALPGEDFSHRGSLTATLRNPLPGRPVIEARLTSNGNTSFGAWDANLALGASGNGWRDMDWRLRADRLALTGDRAVTLDGLAANVETRGDVVTLTSLRGPGKVVASGHGRYNLADKAWDLRLDLSNLPRAVTFGRQTPLAITFNAWGNAKHVRFEKPGLHVRGAEAELTAEGWYYRGQPEPLDVKMHVKHVPPRVAATDDPPLFGYVLGDARLTGTVFPRDIYVEGKLIGRNVRFVDRPIGDVTAAFSGRADAEGVALRTSKIDLLGGTWELHALLPEGGVLGMNLEVTGLPLPEVAAALERPDVEGVIDARFAFIIPRLEAEAVRATADVKARGVKLASLRADTAEITLACADGTLRADPVRLRKDDGTAEATAELDVRAFRQLRATLTLAGWPFEPSPGNKAELWGGTTGVRVTLPGGTDAEGQPVKLGIDGPLDVSAALTLKDQPLGDAHVLADFRGRLFDLRSLSFDGLDGTVQGQALVDLDRPFDTRGSLFWEDFNAGRVPEFFPDNETLVGLSGRLSGSARVGPAPGPRALEPLRVQAFVDSQDFRYRTIPLGDMRMTAFTDLDRLVVEDSLENPTTVELAGGLLRIWGRLSRLKPGDEIAAAPGRNTLLLSQLQVAFERLDLDQIVHAFAPESDRMEGKLAGGFTAIAGTRPARAAGAAPSGQDTLEKVFRRITADGRLEVTESNLGNLDAVDFLYRALSFVPAAEAPEGRGELAFHMEDGLLSLNNVRFFNRGVELRAVADIDRVWEMPDGPIEGTAVGNLRPFRDLKLPFFAASDVDKVFTALQGDAAAVRLSGPLRDYDLTHLALSELGQGIRMLIVGDAEKAKRRAR
ncbi:MAG: hypothetical protein AVDCRST_MAG64-1359, partial [uncultured Phycisphaerae bacterium]